MNEEQLSYLLSRKYVLVLPDISGMQDTDSLLIKTFVERGGMVLLFGPHIPYGDLFDREALVGGNEEKPRRHAWIDVQEPICARVKKGTRFEAGAAAVSSWKPASARPVAVFEDGSAAALSNDFGKGVVVTVSCDLRQSSGLMPEFIRDILDFALARHGLKRPFDIEGATQDMDMAMTMGDGSPAAAVMNYGPKPADIALYPLDLAPAQAYVLTDLKTGTQTTRKGRDIYPLRMRVGSHDFVAIKIKPE